MLMSANTITQIQASFNLLSYAVSSVAGPDQCPAAPDPYQTEKKNPARGEKTIMMIEKVKHSMEISVARFSEGNMFWSRVLVRTCKASSANAAINPPAIISR